MTMTQINNINFDKNPDGLIPVIIQHHVTKEVLMLGYQNREALQKTMEENRVYFFSRKRQSLWLKGETSGNFLNVVSLYLDCDQDTLLIFANPVGPTCHTGARNCFGTEIQEASEGFLVTLEQIISDRWSGESTEKPSYVQSLKTKGLDKIAQKVGEEAVELIIEAKNENRDLFLGEAADLLFHYLVLLKAKNYSLADVEAVLLKRSRAK